MIVMFAVSQERTHAAVFSRQTHRPVEPICGGGLRYALPVAIAVIALWIAWRLFRRRRRAPVPLSPDLTVLVANLGNDGPPQGLPALELYNLPVRLAAVVLAPVGRGRDLPPNEQLPTLIEAIVPGLDKVAALHRPLVRRWPNQVSARVSPICFSATRSCPATAARARRGRRWPACSR